jgi:hypothetical protein
MNGIDAMRTEVIGCKKHERNISMKYFLKFVIFFIFAVYFVIIIGCIKVNHAMDKANFNFSDILVNITKDILLLKSNYPQLSDFSISNVDFQTLKIWYEYRCHQSDDPGSGWAYGAPNPDNDGLWFYIGLWDENDPIESNAQINTQPVIPTMYIKDKRVTFLILEGSNTSLLNEQLKIILVKNGLIFKN